MGRKSKLSDEQWAEVGRRLIEGESARGLAREFSISEASLRGHFEKIGKAPTVQKVAHMIVETEAALKALPQSAQVSAQNLAAKLRSISESLAAGAELGAKNFHRLNAIANTELQKLDEAEINGEASVTALRNVSVLTKVANDCASGSLNLIAANRDTVKRLNEEGEPEAEDLSPERQMEAARRMAFILHRAANPQEPAHG